MPDRIDWQKHDRQGSYFVNYGEIQRKMGSSTVCTTIMLKIYNKQIQNVESTCFTRKISINLNVQTNLDLPIDKPRRGGKSQTAQGEAQRNPGIRHWIILSHDSLRVEDVPQELDSSWRQWYIREIIALTNMSFRIGTPYPSMPVLVNVVRCHIPRVTLRFTLACHGVMKWRRSCLTLAALSGRV